MERVGQVRNIRAESLSLEETLDNSPEMGYIQMEIDVGPQDLARMHYVGH